MENRGVVRDLSDHFFHCIWVGAPQDEKASESTERSLPQAKHPTLLPKPTAQEAKVTQIFSTACTRSVDNWQGQLESASVNRFLFYPPSGSS